MKPTWKKTCNAALLSVSLVFTAFPAAAGAAAEPYAVQQLEGKYALAPNIWADVKSVSNEVANDTNRIGVVVRLYNEGSRLTRVPDYEVRVKTVSGIEYKLTPSVANVKSVQPREQVELSYRLALDSEAVGDLAELSWVEVDEYVYPKAETAMLTLPLDGLVWKGGDSVAADSGDTIAWGQPFTIPVQNNAIRYTPVTIITEKTAQGPVSVITFIAENIGGRTETVPDFRIDGVTDTRTYSGKRVEQQIELKPGEKKYMHFGILTEDQVELVSLNVLTPESFVQMVNNAPVVESYTVGRLNIALPPKASFDLSSLPEYKLNDRITFDPLNKLVDKETAVSLASLSMNESDSAGYKTIIAKFLVTNNSERTVVLPAFQAELTNAEGFRYTGTRQMANVQQLAPKLSYVVNYAFTVPSTETGEGLLMKLQDGQTIAPYNIPIAGFKTAVSTVAADGSEESDVLSFYPYNVKLNSWSLSANGGIAGYTYKLKLDADVTTVDNVVADSASSTIKFELHDTLGRMIASETMPLSGMNRLVSGSQYIVFQNLRTDQFEWPLTLKVYESIQTPNGEAKRLVKTL